MAKNRIPIKELVKGTLVTVQERYTTWLGEIVARVPNTYTKLLVKDITPHRPLLAGGQAVRRRGGWGRGHNHDLGTTHIRHIDKLSFTIISPDHE